MGKHTQGEWIARPDPNGGARDWCIGLNDDVTPIDYIAVCNDRDAHVIAAAPDLLEALVAAHELNKWAMECFGFDADLSKASTAIAKATA